MHHQRKQYIRKIIKMKKSPLYRPDYIIKWTKMLPLGNPQCLPKALIYKINQNSYIILMKPHNVILSNLQVADLVLDICH